MQLSYYVEGEGLWTFDDLPGQFVDHDLTMDATAVSLGQDVTVDELVDGRSPALDLDSVYGRGPQPSPRPALLR
ncbi:MAG: hypothetical protein M3319_04750, partial [Actinomycetota bacterium]|nr:hypothetical protein [Actinomycetota bacterium]MDQ3899769.1 hypothetical protein [Actinomycetota bacterium]